MVYLLLGLVGLCAGSFAGATAWRIYEQDFAPKKARHKKDLSVLRGRSMCETCHRRLGAGDLIPLLSWLELRGRCRYCGARLSWQYPILELLGASLFICSYIWWPYTFNSFGIALFGLWLAVLICFLVLLVTDLRWMLLPNRVVYPLIGISVGFAGVLGLYNASWMVAGLAAVSAAILGGIFYLLFQLSDGKWLGGGDVKLVGALGLLAATPLKSTALLFIASSLGTVVGVPLLLAGRKQKMIPFGPFLMLAAIVIVLFGAQLVGWYDRRILGV